MNSQRKRNPRLRIGVVGMGHVGLATALAFAAHGREVIGYDVNEKGRDLIARGIAPWYEPGLSVLLKREVGRHRLTVVDSVQELVNRTKLLFLCVPTPSQASGEIDLSFIRRAGEEVGAGLRSINEWRSVILKSTAIPGTTEGPLASSLLSQSGKRLDIDFGVGANPEFLAEGTLIADALRPYRIVLGVRERRTATLLRQAYAGFPSKLVELTPAGAELAKYAANAMLATRVSFANEISRLAEAAGANVDTIMEAVGMDPRIGPLFLRAGPGFGGSCFAKDLSALLGYGKSQSVDLRIPAAVLDINQTQATRLVRMAEEELGTVQGKRVAILGLSFKADSDDVAESRAYPLFVELVRKGAHPILYDPRATANFLRGLSTLGPEGSSPKEFDVAQSAREALGQSDVAIVQTDWPEFKKLRPADWKRLADHLVIDARRILSSSRMVRAGIRYRGIGLPRAPGGPTPTSDGFGTSPIRHRTAE